MTSPSSHWEFVKRQEFEARSTRLKSRCRCWWPVPVARAARLLRRTEECGPESEHGF